MITERLQKSRKFIESECAKVAEGSKFMSGTQACQNSEIVSQRQRGKLGTCRIRTPSIDGRRMCGSQGD